MSPFLLIQSAITISFLGMIMQRKIILDPIYSRACPSCGGDAEAISLEKTGICTRCFSTNNKYTLSALESYHDLLEETEYFAKFFQEINNGFRPWGAQRAWAKRLLKKENTVIIAPTGMGKTTLLITYALYAVKEYNHRVLYLAPTKALAKQIYEKLKTSGMSGARIVFYDSSLSKKKREEILSTIKNGQYDILVVTNHFLSRYNDIIMNSNPDIIMIDDVDSLMRSAKSIVKLLHLLGYDDEVIELIKKKHSILWKLIVLRSLNKEEESKELIKKLLEIEIRIDEKLANIKRKQVIISSATGRMRGGYASVLRDLLRTDISGITIYGRNITDTYYLFETHEELASRVIDVIKKLGPGCLVLISPRHPLKDLFKQITSILKNKELGLTIAEASPRSIKMFIEGKIDVIIGSSSYYGMSVRGIDAPEYIKYVIFLGTPAFTIDLDNFLTNISLLSRASLLLYEETNKNNYREIGAKLRNLLFKLSPGERRLLSYLMKGKITIDDITNEKIIRLYNEVNAYYKQIMGDLKEILEKKKILNMGTITLYYDERSKSYKAIIPDVMTYIQASGRTSRLLMGKMTHGLSIIFENTMFSNVVKSLEKRLNIYNDQLLFKELDQINLQDEIRKIKESRTKKNEATSLKYKNVLLVVESPTKARTIARFFGKPTRRKIGSVSVYEIPFISDDTVIHMNVIATRGHIYDLTTEPLGVYGVIFEDSRIAPKYETIKRCRICGYQFTFGDKCPRCGSTAFYDSIEIVNVLRKLASEADEVYIATDPDIEGEKIAYDVYLTVRPFVKEEQIWRIELHEITLSELRKALNDRRRINKKLVNAEIYRRVLDRLIGFSLSQKLWIKYGKNWLGAGRVQTPVLGWIIDQYNKWKLKRCKLVILSLPNDLKIRFHLDKTNYREIVSIIKNKGIKLEVKEITEKTFNPQPPYTTDKFLEDASRLGIPSKLAMKIAQELFESGLITYHRTDYTYVSSTGISIARQYIEKHGFNNLFKPSHWGDKGAHEAIRPTHPLDVDELIKAVSEGLINPTIPLTGLHYKIYGMIFNRFIASQLKPYKARVAKIIVYAADKKLAELELVLEILEHGYDVVRKVKTYSSVISIAGNMMKPSSIKVVDSSLERLHSEGSIIKLMKTKGLGRPSTYASIISSIVRHGYVIRSKKKGYLIPTKTGIEVYDYLVKNYAELVSEITTKHMEETIDMIASGKVNVEDAIINVLEKITSYRLPTTVSLPTSSVES